MIQYLAESENFKVYSFYENVYLKNKSTSININKLDYNDLLIADHYGDPNNALILPNEKYITTRGEILYGLEPSPGERYIGVAFLNPPEELQQHIREYVNNAN